MNKYRTILVVLALLCLHNMLFAKSIKITGKLSFLNTGDTVQVKITKYPELRESAQLFNKHEAVAKGNSFELLIDSGEPYVYVSLSFKNKSAAALPNYFCLADGDVQTSDEDGAYHFQGILGKLFEAQYVAGRILNQKPTMKFNGENLVTYFNALDENYAKALQYLDGQKEWLDGSALLQLRANTFFGIENYKYQLILMYGHQQMDSIHLAFTTSYQQYMQNKLSVELPFSDANKRNSSSFASFLIGKYRVDSCFIKGEPVNDRKALAFFKSNYPAILSERLAVNYMLSRGPKLSEDLRNEFDYLQANLRDTNFRRILSDLSIKTSGGQIKNYTLIGEDGQKVGLHDFKGKVVVLDFYYTGCGNCKLIAPILHQVEKRFKGKEVIFLSISIDRSRDKWLSSVRSRAYSSGLSKDLYTSGNGADDPIIQELKIIGYPTLIILDKDGKPTTAKKDLREDNGADLTTDIEKRL